ncbi:MAG: rane fusion protein Cu(I)/Ag(I) efflux system [Segetibacter sp.]|jgi:ssDNA-binding Zn-finger/Zn-ribbon topoisomerase 1|nr:rane fusion protein Cu(I)/Ag(I) efflux system [Segetibacter sp.]
MKHLLLISIITLTIGLTFSACSGNANNVKTEQLAQDQTYTCTMHNEVMSDHEAECPKCGMKLVKQKMTAEQQKMKTEGTYVKPKG